VAAEDPAVGLDELGKGAVAVASGEAAQAPPAAQQAAQQAPSAGAGPGAPEPSQNRGRPNRGGNGAGGQARRPASGSIAPSGSPLGAGPPAKVGRNEPCWCGSGRKFKVCHGAS
jgi:preprotein translocase subunit SecA